jgi:uncharacterized protein YceK
VAPRNIKRVAASFLGRFMSRLIVLLVVLLCLSGCASAPVTVSKSSGNDASVPLFSANSAGGLPHGWKPLVILRNKKSTEYQLVADDFRTVLHARADRASSALMHEMDVDPAARPWLSWEWKISSLLKNADNTQRATEDSPVRIILGFDGDKESLPFADQVMFETAKVVTGHDFPYATLMYIWENKAPVGTVIRSPHSGRIKMMVAASGTDGIGEWRLFMRNVVEDFEKAFGEKPGRLIGIGVLTDTDNTGETVEAWYGDIRLLRESTAAARASRLANGLPLQARK